MDGSSLLRAAQGLPGALGQREDHLCPIARPRTMGGAALRQYRGIFALTAPAYLWLALSIFLPLSAMVYFRNAWRSFELGIYVTVLCVLFAYPAALILAKHVKGRWREALFLLVILPFWSNALIRTFSWTMVLRGDVGLLFSYPAIVIGLVHAYLPYAILTCYISLESIDDSLLQAARSLGATPAQTFA